MSTMSRLAKPAWKVSLTGDFQETLHSRWYQVYVTGFAAVMALFFFFGLSESDVLGYTGLGRTLLTFIQISIVALPVFVLTTTARTLASDREAGVWEYVLALPISLRAYYWGKAAGRTLAIVAPLVAALFLAGAVEWLRGHDVPWAIVAYYAALLSSLVVCFLGIALLISVLAATQEMALGVALGFWFVTEALVDALLLGLLLREQLRPEALLGLAMLNPLQAFRMAAIALFDPDLTALGPIAYTILADIGRTGLFLWAIAWPVTLGLGCAWLGARFFTTKDIL
jgi:ABC-2 type transport system permease protein